MFTKHGKEEIRRPILATLAALGLTAATIAATASPASADDTTDNATAVTFELVAGALEISAPGSADLGAAASAAATVDGPLGTVTVVDGRGATVSTWTANVSASDFTDAAGNTIAASNITYTPGTPEITGLFTGNTGLKAFSPGVLTGLTSSPAPIGTQISIGSNSATWNPTLLVRIPPGSIAGVYTATITHSVS